MPHDIVIEEAAKSTQQINRCIFPSEPFYPVIQDNAAMIGIQFQHPCHLPVDPGIFTHDFYQSDQ
jgi:hypothetical protein